ncbi:MAG: CRISPR-associated protein Cas4 [Planctomycetota bacterium]
MSDPAAAWIEEDWLPVSALADLIFCERRAALHHIEHLWTDNVFTLEGTHVHERVDVPGGETESRKDVRIARGVPLRSARMGLTGKADVVEFHKVNDDAPRIEGAVLPGAAGRWMPFPVEYKRGKAQRSRSYEVQLCAQALCMEESFGVVIPCGALFYGATHHRFDVAFDTSLRAETERAAARLHQLIESRVTPKPFYEKKCESCSLLELCKPKVMGRSAVAYLSQALAAQINCPI